MYRILIFMAVCHWLTLPVAGQYAVSGLVTDSAEGSTLPGAHVVVEDTYRGVLTDRHGRFDIDGLQPGHYTLLISFMGYETHKETLELQEDIELEVALNRSASLAEEVVVTAVRAGGRAPVTHTNIGREELAMRNLGQDLPMLLSHTPSLTVSSDAGTGIGYTWMSIRGSDQSRINVTINGIPVNDAESQGVWWVNMPDIVSSVEDLQVQRGLGLSTHGAGAFGATINLRTASLRDQTYAEVSSAAGAFNTLKNTVNVGTGLINEKWAFDGRLSMVESDGYIDRASAGLRSFYLSGGYYGRNTLVKGVVFSGKETTYQAWYGVPSDSLGVNRTFNPAGMYVDEAGDVQFYDNETDNYQQDHYQLHLTHQVRNGLVVTGALHYTYGRGYYEQFRQNERFSRYDLPPVTIGEEEIDRSDLVRRRWLDNHFYGLTYSVNYNDYAGLELTLGGGYNEYDGDHFGEIIWARYALNTDIRHRYYDNNGFKKDANQFLKASYELIPGLHLFGDLQYRYVSYSFLGKAWVLGQVQDLQQKVHYHFLNPKAGLSYDLNPSSTVYLYAGMGKREPVRRDFTESSPDSRPRPETLRNLELGYERRGRQSAFGVNLYLMDYVDQLVLTGEINDVGGFSRTNIAESYRLGIEMEGQYRFSDRLRWSGNLSLSRNKIPLFEEHSDMYDDDWNWVGTDVRTYKNTDIAFSPGITGASQLAFSPLNALQLHLESQYVGEQYIDNTMSSDRMLDAYLIHHLRVMYSLSLDRIREVELLVQWRNLFNVKYETNAWIYKGVVGEQGLVTIEDGFFPQAGRHLLLGLNLRF